MRERIARVAALDPGLRLFGANLHRYRCSPPADLGRIEEREARWAVRLPEDYRTWITTVGNGGAGPGVGLEALKLDRESLGGRFPGNDTPFELDDDDDDDAFDAEVERWQSGTITLADTGSGYGNRFVLVADGAATQRVWLENTFEDYRWSPVDDSFSAFMEHWLSELEDRAETARADRELRMDSARSARDHYQLGRIYQQELAQPRTADTWYQRALASDPNHVPAAVGRAQVLNAIGFHESAANLARRVRDQCDPTPRAGHAQHWPRLTHELGVALHARGDFEGAAEALDAAQASLRRDHTFYLPPRIESHLRCGRRGRAQELLEVALRGAGTSLDSVGYQSAIFLDRRVRDRAERTCLTLAAAGFAAEAERLRALRGELSE